MQGLKAWTALEPLEGAAWGALAPALPLGSGLASLKRLVGCHLQEAGETPLALGRALAMAPQQQAGSDWEQAQSRLVALGPPAPVDVG